MVRRCSKRRKFFLGQRRDLDIARHAHDFFLPRIWELRERVTAYDAAYLALAEALAAPLLTLDRRLARAGGHRARIDIAG